MTDKHAIINLCMNEAGIIECPTCLKIYSNEEFDEHWSECHFKKYGDIFTFKRRPSIGENFCVDVNKVYSEKEEMVLKIKQEPDLAAKSILIEKYKEYIKTQTKPKNIKKELVSY